MRLLADELEIVVDLRGIDVIRRGVATRHDLSSVAYARQDRAFFDAVRAGEPRQVFCTYADALADPPPLPRHPRRNPATIDLRLSPS